MLLPLLLNHPLQFVPNLMSMGGNPNTICRNAANSVSDTVSQATSGASKEGNKQVAKDDNASLGTRASAAKDAAGDKVNEEKAKA